MEQNQAHKYESIMKQSHNETKYINIKIKYVQSGMEFC